MLLKTNKGVSPRNLAVFEQILQANLPRGTAGMCERVLVDKPHVFVAVAALDQ